MMDTDTRTNRYVLGAGKLFFAPESESGSVAAERYIGNTPGFEISIESTRIDLFDSDGPTAEKVEDVVTQVVRSSIIQCNNISDENLALFVIGELSEVASAAGNVLNESFGTVQGDRWYQLGSSEQRPSGVRAVSDVALDDGSTPYTLGVDYELDVELGRFYVLPEGAMVGNPVFADYNTTDGAMSRIITADLGSIVGALRYIANNTRGPNRDVYASRVQLSPDGSLAFKSRTDWMQMQFNAEFLKRSAAYPALEINGRQVLNGSGT